MRVLKKRFFSQMGFSACAQEILHPKPSPSLSLHSLPFFPTSPSHSFSPSASPSPSLSMPEMPNVPGYQACRSNDSFHPSFSLSLTHTHTQTHTRTYTRTGSQQRTQRCLFRLSPSVSVLKSYFFFLLLLLQQFQPLISLSLI